ncbi:hypothetical protein Hanom_Chr00s037795g01773131 [Helianthus anomalus]
MASTTPGPVWCVRRVKATTPLHHAHTVWSKDEKLYVCKFQKSFRPNACYVLNEA